MDHITVSSAAGFGGSFEPVVHGDSLIGFQFHLWGIFVSCFCQRTSKWIVANRDWAVSENVKRSDTAVVAIAVVAMAIAVVARAVIVVLV